MKRLLLASVAVGALTAVPIAGVSAQGQQPTTPPGLEDKGGVPPGLQGRTPPGLEDKGGMPPGLQRGESEDQQARQPGQLQRQGAEEEEDQQQAEEPGAEEEQDGELDQQQAEAMAGEDQQFMEALNNLSSEVQNLQQATQVGNVQVVTLDQTVKGKAEVTNAIDQNASSIQELQAAIENNQQIQSALEQENLSTADVVAADVESDGKVKVFAHKEK